MNAPVLGCSPEICLSQSRIDPEMSFLSRPAPEAPGFVNISRACSYLSLPSSILPALHSAAPQLYRACTYSAGLNAAPSNASHISIFRPENRSSSCTFTYLSADVAFTLTSSPAPCVRTRVKASSAV